MKNTQTNVGSFATAKLQAKRRSLLAIAMVAVIGFTMAACKEPEPEGPSVSVSGTPKIGEKLTATSKGGDFRDNFLWAVGVSKETDSWPSLDESYFYRLLIKKEGTQDWLEKTDVISGEFDSEFTLRSELKQTLVGKYIRVYRRPYIGPSTFEQMTAVIGPITE